MTNIQNLTILAKTFIVPLLHCLWSFFQSYRHRGGLYPSPILRWQVKKVIMFKSGPQLEHYLLRGGGAYLLFVFFPTNFFRNQPNITS